MCLLEKEGGEDRPSKRERERENATGGSPNYAPKSRPPGAKTRKKMSWSADQIDLRAVYIDLQLMYNCMTDWAIG